MNESDKTEVYNQLNIEREFVTSPDSGYVVKKEAWQRIDLLLDRLIILNEVQDV